jgi:hypothetical protein
MIVETAIVTHGLNLAMWMRLQSSVFFHEPISDQNIVSSNTKVEPFNNEVIRAIAILKLLKTLRMPVGPVGNLSSLNT